MKPAGKALQQEAASLIARRGTGHIPVYGAEWGSPSLEYSPERATQAKAV